MKKILIGLVLVAAAGSGAWYVLQPTDESVSYRFVEVEQGDLESTVSATGTLSAVRTVEVGTQVSGQVAQIYVDFNDRVTRGQLVARIDPTLLNLAVEDAKATLERSQAELTRAQSEYDRKQKLYERQVITEEEFNVAEYSLALAKANLKGAEVDLDRAERNLAYTNIYAPVDGVVIERNVDVGQTVAASLSAPTLFLIAEDLAKMEILVSVDESDIGQIQEGQPARFTVQAYPDETFMGAVRQVRLQSTTQENVVNYTVVVDVDNAGGKLLPGMTATVDFLIETAADVFKVANAALRFRPTEAMLAELQAQRQAARQGTDSTAGGGFRSRSAGQRGEGGGMGMQPGAGMPADIARLWYVDEDGTLRVLPVRTGISDGQATEIMGPNVQPGMQIIASVTAGGAASTSVNPFQSSQQRGGPPGRF